MMQDLSSGNRTDRLAAQARGGGPVIIGPDVPDLGYVLKQVPNSDFKMDGFDDRLRLQKIVYMLQAFGVNLGYGFSWYFRGPYCTSLARAGFELEQVYGMIPDGAEVRPVDPRVRDGLKRCIKFLKGAMGGPHDLNRLEIAASIHLLVRTTSLTKQGIFRRVMEKMSLRGITEDMCEDMWRRLCKEGLVSDGRP